MKKLNENQILFILENFFENDQYPGWNGIGRKLLETGECIVAGKECIWQGGIGNFIDTVDAENAIDCLLYIFNLEFFLSSKWYAEIATLRMAEMEEDQAKALTKYEGMVRNLRDVNDIYEVSNV